MTANGIPCTWMRGGTSKGGFFLASDLPSDAHQRDQLLLSIMGSPDDRQIDGMGGARSLTSKVAIINPSTKEGVDVEYLFLQISVEKAQVSDTQNCGNMLSGVAPFAIERGLVNIQGDETRVTIFQHNSEQIAVATVVTKNGEVNYWGDAAIDGVPGTAAPVLIEFQDTAGSLCGELLPSGSVIDTIDEINVTLIDNGMPCVLLSAEAMGLSGKESPEALESNHALRQRLESLRLACAFRMNLGDATEKTVPKMVLLSPPAHGGSIHTRSFIPHSCHTSIGVLGAVSVATACVTPGTIAHKLSSRADSATLIIEHPTGALSVVAKVVNHEVKSAAVIRTARKLMEGRVFT